MSKVREALIARNTTHGLRRHPLYSVWTDMHTRCTNRRAQSFPRYGGRGIKVCERWQSFEAFLADMGERPTSEHQIDRIDNDGDYGPANCRWATRKEQAANRRNSRFLETSRGRMTLTEASRLAGVNPSTMSERLSRGWTGERLFRGPWGRAHAG